MTVGIDYSMTCPAACLYTDAPQFWIAHNRTYPTCAALTTTEITTTDVIPRAELVASGLIAWLSQCPNVRAVAIEDYAFSATGRVFHIGEHTGVLKYLLYKNGYAVKSIPPTVIKKFATGKGNADKPRMTDAFLNAYPSAQAWRSVFFPRTAPNASPAKSPLADLADAYWIAKYAATLT
jgi:hypothetical protein